MFYSCTYRHFLPSSTRHLTFQRRSVTAIACCHNSQLAHLFICTQKKKTTHNKTHTKIYFETRRSLNAMKCHRKVAQHNVFK